MFIIIGSLDKKWFGEGNPDSTQYLGCWASFQALAEEAKLSEAE